MILVIGFQVKRSLNFHIRQRILYLCQQNKSRKIKKYKIKEFKSLKK